MNLGLHLSGKNYSEMLKAMDVCLEHDIKLFQVFLGNPLSKDPPHFNRVFYSALQEVEYVIHMPFWFSFFNPNVKLDMKRYLMYLDQNWSRLDGRPVILVSHSGSFKGRNATAMRMQLLSNAAVFCRPVQERLNLCIENTSGSFSSFVPSVADLASLKNRGADFGVCIDTEHAYAAGEHPDKLPYELADIIHLNSVPPYVRFGYHLDRHSYTSLQSSKIGTGFVERIVEKTDLTPIIVEKTDFNLGIQDVNTLRGGDFSERKDSIQRRAGTGSGSS